MNTQKRGRRRFLIILVVCFLLAVNITLGFILTMKSSAALTSLIQGRMRDVSDTAASMLDGDTLASLTAQDTGSAAYRSIEATLRQFEANTSLEYVYCIRADGDGGFVYIVDPSDEKPASFGERAVSTEARRRASEGIPSVDEHSYTDAWGEFYSSYSPVFTSTGEVAGIVAVDFDAAWYDEQIGGLIRTVVAVATLSLLVGVLFVLVLTRREIGRYRVLHSQLNVLAGKVEELVREVDDVAELPELASKPDVSPRRRLSAHRAEDIDQLGEKVLGMQEEIRRHIYRIKTQAYRDGLTGLGNRTAHFEIVRHLDDEVAQGKAQFAVAIFDLNGLKQINDTYGHECGDLALVDAANRLKQVFGASSLYRVGGDEFVAVMDNTSEPDMRRLMGKLDEVLAEANTHERPYVLPLALSKGAAVYAAGSDDGYQSVSRRADRLMYDDKAAYYRHTADRRRR